MHGEEEASSEVLEFFRKQGANGGKIGVKRSLETMTPKKRTAPRQKASDAAVAARKEKRQSVKRDRGKNVTSESGASRRYGECLLVAEFSGALDAWFEQLHLKVIETVPLPCPALAGRCSQTVVRGEGCSR